MKSLTVRELIARFETWAIKRLAKGTVLNYRRHLLRFATAVGDVDAESLRAHHLVEWATTWHEFVSIQRAWNWAYREAELLERNPFARVKRPKLGRRKRIFKRHELAAFLRASPGDLRAYLLALRESIARPQEAREFRWEELRTCDPTRPIAEAMLAGYAYFVQAEFKHRHLRADPDTSRIIPVTPRLGRLMLRLCRGQLPMEGIVFKRSDGKMWTKEAVRLRVKRLRNRLKILPDERGEQVVAYTFRHTAATFAVAHGIRDRMLADMMGNNNVRTTARYQHLSTAHLLEAMRRVHEASRPGSRADRGHGSSPE